MKKILIIEDEAQLRSIYERKLTEEGYAILCASDANEALRLLEKDTPDLILLDIMLPGGKNGFDVLEYVMKSDTLKTIPVLVLTNLDTEEKVAKTIGAKDYIVKANTSIEDVVSKIQVYLPS